MMSVCLPCNTSSLGRFDGLFCYFGGFAVLAAGDRAENQCCEADDFLEVASLVSGASARPAISLDHAMELR